MDLVEKILAEAKYHNVTHPVGPGAWLMFARRLLVIMPPSKGWDLCHPYCASDDAVMQVGTVMRMAEEPLSFTPRYVRSSTSAE